MSIQIRLFSLVSIFLFAFISAPLRSSPLDQQTDQINGQKEVARGSRAFINWHFESAEYVLVSGDSTRYPGTFQIYVTPQITTTYKIKAFRTKDTSELTWTIRVYETEIPKLAQRGGETSMFSLAPKASTEASSFYVGYNPAGSVNNITSMKIVHVEYPDSSHNMLSLHTVFLDRFGNQLSMLPSDQLSLSLLSKCNNNATEYQPIVSEEKWIRSETKMVMTLCIDRSATAEEFDPNIRKAVEDFPFYLGSADKLSVMTFNQEAKTLCTHLTKDKLNNLGESFVDEPQGLHALFKSAYVGLQKLEPREKTKNVLVLVTTGVDNASFIYTVEDVLQKAMLRKARIYTIGIGDMADTYPLRYLASQTGGRYYSVSPDRISDLTSILREITYAVHGSYVLQMPFKSNFLQGCDSAIISLKLKTPETSFVDHYSWTSTTESSLPSYQALSMFGFRQTVVADEYQSLLRSAAQVLKDNPKKLVELSGHSNAEGDEDAMRQLALERVQSVRKQLIELGVNPAQLRGKALGDLKPIFYFQQNDWQKRFNRRVEIRWLDASLQPYEIVAEYSYTETEAIKFTEQWEKRGLKAYFERVLVKGNSAFRVKLWGYATEEQAKSEAASLRKKFNISLDVE